MPFGYTSNRYAFTAGNPISFIELDGHKLAAIGGGGTAEQASSDDGVTCEWGGNARHCTNSNLTGDNSDFVWGAGGFVASTLAALTEAGPGCWFQDCGGDTWTKEYESFAEKHGADTSSDMYEGGKAAASVASLFAGAAGAIKSIVKKWRTWRAGKGGPAAGNGPVIGPYTSKGSGKDLKRSAMVGDNQWHFNTGHGFNRAHTGPGGVKNDLRTTGLTPDEIEKSIVTDVYDYMKGGGSLPRPGSPGFSGPHNGSVQVGGFNVGYRVIRRPDDAYQVATYWLNK